MLRSLSLLVALAGTAHADCPTTVKAAIEKAFHNAKISSCKPEVERGRDQFEVKLTKADGVAIEVDISPEGKILQVEEKIALDQVPAAVMKAFAARYPNAKAERAEKQTRSVGKPTYELAFARKEVTFTEDGAFVDEE